MALKAWKGMHWFNLKLISICINNIYWMCILISWVTKLFRKTIKQTFHHWRMCNVQEMAFASSHALLNLKETAFKMSGRKLNEADKHDKITMTITSSIIKTSKLTYIYVFRKKMLFTGKNPFILYPFPQILINLSRLRYLPKPVRSPFLVCDTSYAAGTFQIPIPFIKSTCSTAKDSAVITRHGFLQSSPALKTILLLEKQNIRHTLLHKRSIYIRHLKNFMCTVSVTWSSENHNKGMLLRSSPAFLTSLLY